MRRIACGVVLLAVGCSSDTGGEVTGPYSGPLRRYEVDVLTLPSTTALTNQFADDLDGDGEPDNQLGLIVAALTQTNDTNKHVPDMIAGGSLASALELQADDLDDDDRVGARYLGKLSSMASQLGGRLVNGELLTNRTRTTKVLGDAEVLLPVFAGCRSWSFRSSAWISSWSGDGAGGFDGIVHGGIPIDRARAIAYAGVLQMMRTNPHRTSRVRAHPRYQPRWRDRRGRARRLRTARGLHRRRHRDRRPGRALRWLRRTPVRGGELCAPRAGQRVHRSRARWRRDRHRLRRRHLPDLRRGALACTTPADCQTGGCDSGTCRAPTCTDGLRDGFESDVDCGAACPDCAAGQRCGNGDDCVSGRCNATVGSSGTCGA
ncbi:MAG: hypothetical protein IPQ07_44745 [Myxococcales bacterium]|nr:hypothetical protein [Myxococcales bacterium]